MALWPCQTPDDDLERPLTPREEIWLALQVSEDTCAAHGVYLCEKCFDLTPVDATS